MKSKISVICSCKLADYKEKFGNPLRKSSDKGRAAV